EVMNPNQLTSEQRQLLEQMQADMRQQPTQLNEVPWNEQTPEQRQQTLQRQRQAQQQQQQQWAQTQPVQQPRTQPRVNEQPQTRTVQSAPAQPARQSQPPKQTASQQPYQDLLQTPAHTSAAAPKAAPITRAPEAPKATAEKKDERRWMVQCGSFKGAEQAESVRAQLAFEGFDSKITTNNGWNRVVIGPVKGKENADSTINRLKMAGHTNCIRLATGG
ncbi:cell division protein FtsN, partial [Salmonella enterica]|nr:cell division protein FtsN [Salmonella enterica subsp. enterica serovar Bredeney]EJU0354811.1 cell division protein FtsN [Salmonella enterica subsp. enterica serovar Bredeney]